MHYEALKNHQKDGGKLMKTPISRLLDSQNRNSTDYRNRLTENTIFQCRKYNSYFFPEEEYAEKCVNVLLDGEEAELVFIDHPNTEISVSFPCQKIPQGSQKKCIRLLFN